MGKSTTSIPDSISVVDVKQSEEVTALKSPKLNWCKTNWRNILSEFVSTTSLLFFGCMSCLPQDGVQPPMYSAVGFGLVVLINVQTFGHLSGAHMNPVVTLASVIWGATSPTLGAVYFVVQCLGATFGYYLLVTLAPNDFERDIFCVTQPKPNLPNVQALGVEAMLTAALIFLCCCLWDPVNKDKQDSTSIKFGLAIAALSICGGPLTGAGMNPARSLGPAIITGMFRDLWVYWCGPLVGGLAAVYLYKYIWLAVEADTSREAQPLNG